MQLLDVIREDSVLAGKSHKIAHVLVGSFEDRAAFQRAPELDGLTGAHQLDGKDIFQVVQDLVEFAAADAAHADMILLPQGGRDAVGAGGETEGLVLGDQGGRGILRDHKSTVESDIAHQQSGSPHLPSSSR